MTSKLRRGTGIQPGIVNDRIQGIEEDSPQGLQLEQQFQQRQKELSSSETIDKTIEDLFSCNMATGLFV